MTIKALTDTADIAAGALAFVTLAKWLPPIAAAFTVLWIGIRVFEWARVVVWKRPPRRLDL